MCFVNVSTRHRVIIVDVVISEEVMSNQNVKDCSRKLTYRIDEVSKASGIGRTFIYELIKKGKLESVKIGRCRLILAESLEALLKGKTLEKASGGHS